MTQARVGLLLVGAFLSISAKAAVGDTVLVFPHIVRGDAGVSFGTLVVLTNPGPDVAMVTMTSEEFDFEGEGEPFELTARESREFLFQGGQLGAGSLLVTANRPVFGAATLSSRSAPASTESLSDATLFAALPASHVSLPVFLGSPFAEDTGVALFYFHIGSVDLRFTLFDDAGQQVASNIQRAPFDPNDPNPGTSRAAFFISQLFTDLPAGFTRGTLEVEEVSPLNIGESFGLVGLYTRGARFWSVPASIIDDQRLYTVKPRLLDDIQGQADELAEIYGFEVRLVLENFFQILATREVARALARDSAVEEVRADQPLTLSTH